MASKSFDLTTYYAKRIIGDTAAEDADKALLLTGANINTDTWILYRTVRGSTNPYGIIYTKDTATNGTADKIEFYGNGTSTAWIQLDTGDASFNSILGKVEITNIDIPNTATSYYFPYVSSSSSGVLALLTSGRIYLYEGTNRTHICIGNSTRLGGITLWGGSKYTDIITEAATSNKTVHIPNYSGWIAVGGDGSSTGVGNSYIPVYLSASGLLTTTTSYFVNGSTNSHQLGGFSVVAASTTHTDVANYAGHRLTLMTTDDGLFLWDHLGGDSGLGANVWSWRKNSSGIWQGSITGNAVTATRANITTTKYGITYYSDATGTFASTTYGAAGQVLIGKGSNDAADWYGGLTLTGTLASDWQVTINGTSSSSSTDTGALVVNGGVGVAGKLYVNSEIWTNASLKVRPNNRYKNIHFIQNGTTNIAGRIEYDSGDKTNITGGRFHFVQYSPNDPNDTGTTGHYEYYYFPTVDSGRSTDKAYKILTEKNTVTIALGGTGNTSYTASRLIYTNTAATQLVSTTIVSNGEYLSNISYLTINADHLTDYRLKVSGKIASTSSITLLGTDASTATISFSRASVNYINIPTNGSLGFSINGSAGANVLVLVSSGVLSCYANKRSSLGSSGVRWSALYSGSGDFDGPVSISDTTAINTSNYTTGALVVSGGASFASAIIVNGWVRTFGDNGWYSLTHGGGLCMRDDSYVRMYGQKQFLITTNKTASDETAASNKNLSSQLIISSLAHSTTAAALNTTAGGAVAIELWRGSNASWQIVNDGGTLKFRSNYTTSRQDTYSVLSLSLNYKTGNVTTGGQFYRSGVSSAWNKGRDNAAFALTTISGYSVLASAKTSNGSWDIGVYTSSNWVDHLIFSYVPDGTADGAYEGTNETPVLVRFNKNGSILADGSIWAGILNDTSMERDVGVRSGAGDLYMYSVASATGGRGLYVHAHGNGSAKSIIEIDKDNEATFYGAVDLNDERSIYGRIKRKQAGAGGWAYTPLSVYDNAGTNFAHFGVHGTANTMNYIYIGANGYDGNNLRITPEGAVTLFSQLTISGTTTGGMAAGTTNPKITFVEGASTLPVHLIYTDQDSYRSPAGLKVVGGTSATPAWFEVEGLVYSGDTSAATERSFNAVSNSGLVLIYSTGNSSSNGQRGLWFNAHGTATSGFSAVVADTNTNVWHVARGTGAMYILRTIGEPWPYIRFDSIAGGSTYVTTAQDGWAQIFCLVPAKRASDNYYYSTQFLFREYSKTANSTTRRSYYETYYLPAATDGLSSSPNYNILTDKNTVTVALGGTGASSFTANSVIISGSTTTSALTTRSLLNNTSVSHLGWSSSTGNGTYILTANSLAYWNGRYNSSTSNLTYCKVGEFGTIITANYPTSSTNTVFLRGDGTWTSTLAATYVSNIDGARYIIKSTHGQSSSATVMFFGENADGTTQGIYSYGYRTSSTAALTSDAKYLVYRNSAGNIFLNGTASTASKLTDITSADAASSNTTERYMWFSYSDNVTGRPAYDTNFTYRTDIGQLTYKQWKILPYGGTYGTGGNGTIWYNGTSSVTASGEIADRVRCTKTFEAAALATRGTIQLRLADLVKGTTFTSEQGRSILFLEKGTGVAATNRIGMIYAYLVTNTLNTRIGFLAYRSASGSSTNGYLYLHYGWDGSTADIRTVTNAKIYGAVWNDYAEFRRTNDKAIPGQVVIDNDDGTLSLTTKRLLLGAQVVTDTFGFAIGETDETKTPLAVSGRVLVYTYRDRYEYHAGQAVCSAPDGTVDIMSRDEIMMYPDAIVGIVSEIPEYEEWGQENVKVNGRIWIKVK